MLSARSSVRYKYIKEVFYMAEIFNGILWRFAAFVLDCPYITFFCAVLLVVVSIMIVGKLIRLGGKAR